MRHPFLLLAGAALVAQHAIPAYAQAESIQVTVSADVPLTSTSSKSVNAAMEQAKEVARKNAWKFISRRPDLQDKVRGFTPERDAAMAASLVDYCTGNDRELDYVVDKQRKMLSARFRFDCEQSRLQDELNRIKGNGASIQSAQSGQYNQPTSAPAQPVRLATFFLLKEVGSRTQFDPTVNRYANQSVKAGVTATDKVDARYQSDIKEKSSYSGGVRSTEGYGESTGSVQDSYRESGQLQTRDQSKGKVRAESVASSEVAVGVEASQHSHGQTTNQASQTSYRSVSPEGLNSHMSETFDHLGVKIVEYSSVYEAPCAAGMKPPSPDELAAAYKGDLNTSVRNRIIAVLKQCRFTHFAIGEADANGTTRNSTTGWPQYVVSVRGKVFDLTDEFPTVHNVEREATAASEVEDTAFRDAVAQAGERTAEAINSILVSNGVR